MKKIDKLSKSFLEINEIRNHNHFNILLNKLLLIVVNEMIQEIKDKKRLNFWLKIKEEIENEIKNT